MTTPIWILLLIMAVLVFIVLLILILSYMSGCYEEELEEELADQQRNIIFKERRKER